MQFVIHLSTIITNEKNQILLVKEKKEKIFNKLNLPGGHMELGEGLVEGAKREAMEEVNVDVEILGLIGVFTGLGIDHYINFIFAGKINKGEPSANKEHINDFGWYSPEGIEQLPEDQFVNAYKLKNAITVFQTNQLMPLELIKEMVYQSNQIIKIEK